MVRERLVGLDVARCVALTGGREPVHGEDRRRASAGLAVRALLLAVLGFGLGALDSGLAVILTYYGVLFLLGLLFGGLRSRCSPPRGSCSRPSSPTWSVRSSPTGGPLARLPTCWQAWRSAAATSATAASSSLLQPAVWHWN